MIDIVLSTRCVRKLKRELRAAGSMEIGGVLAAEQIADGKFVVKDLSVQRDGSVTSFNREPAQHRKFMRRFQMLNGSNPERFNYLGEWHSHPRFPALPSEPDVRQMQALIEDPHQVANFLVLLVIKIGREGGLFGSTHAFRAGQAPIRVHLKAEAGHFSVREEEVIAASSAHRNWWHCSV